MPEESPTVVAQFGGFGPAPGTLPGASPTQPPTAPATTPAAASATPPTPQVAATNQPAAANANQPAGQPTAQPAGQANAKPVEPRKPVEWKTPETDPPVWLKGGMADLEEQERELRDVIRLRMRNKIDINFH